MCDVNVKNKRKVSGFSQFCQNLLVLTAVMPIYVISHL